MLKLYEILQAPCLRALLGSFALPFVVFAAGVASAQDCAVPAQYVTISAALADNGCEVIAVASGTYNESLNVDRSVTIQGAGMNDTIISTLSGESGVVMRVASQLTIADLTIESHEGLETYVWTGDGVYVRGQLTLNRVNINWFATAIHADQNSTFIEVHESVLYGNRRGVDTYGTPAMFVMEDSLVSNNWPEGGLVLGETEISDSTIEYNFAESSSGGGIFLGNGGSLEGVNVHHNIAGVFGGSAGYDSDGGGIFILGSANNVFLRDSTIEDNEAARDGAGIAVHGCPSVACSATGGAYGTLRMSDTLVRGNDAYGAGGGISIAGYAYIHDSLIAYNHAWVYSLINPSGLGEGGGISLDGGEAYIERSAVSHNGADGNGGGIVNGIGTTAPGALTLVNSTVGENRADGSGGGVYNRGALHVYSSTISLNVVDADGDSIGTGGGLYSAGGSNEVLSSILHRNSTAASRIDDCAGGYDLNSYGANLFGRPSTACPVVLAAGASPVPDLWSTKAVGLVVYDESELLHYIQPSRKSLVSNAGYCESLSGLGNPPVSVDQLREQRRGCDIGAVLVR